MEERIEPAVDSGGLPDEDRLGVLRGDSGQREEPLLGQVDTGTRGREHTDVRGAAQHVREGRDPIDEVLEVVEHDEETLGAEVAQQLRREVAHREGRQASGVRDARVEEVRIRYAGERYEDSRIRGTSAAAAHRLHHQARLADTPGPHDGEPAAVGVVEPAQQRRDVRVAADDDVGIGRQRVVARRGEDARRVMPPVGCRPFARSAAARAALHRACELDRGVVGLDADLLEEASAEGVVVRQRFRHPARVAQESHDRAMGGLVQGLEREQRPTCPERRLGPTGLESPFDGALVGGEGERPKPLGLGGEPRLELRARVEMEAREEVAPVERGGAVDVSGVQPPLELERVDHHRSDHADRLPVGPDVGGEEAAEPVHGGAEVRASALRVVLGPEQVGEHVARDGAVLQRQVHEEALRRPRVERGERAATDPQSQAAERADLENLDHAADSLRRRRDELVTLRH
jgi:hypothetical protein